jgi:hypothetical protein
MICFQIAEISTLQKLALYERKAHKNVYYGIKI